MVTCARTRGSIMMLLWVAICTASMTWPMSASWKFSVMRASSLPLRLPGARGLRGATFWGAPVSCAHATRSTVMGAVATSSTPQLATVLARALQRSENVMREYSLAVATLQTRGAGGRLVGRGRGIRIWRGDARGILIRTPVAELLGLAGDQRHVQVDILLLAIPHYRDACLIGVTEGGENVV